MLAEHVKVVEPWAELQTVLIRTTFAGIVMTKVPLFEVDGIRLFGF